MTYKPSHPKSSRVRDRRYMNFLRAFKGEFGVSAISIYRALGWSRSKYSDHILSNRGTVIDSILIKNLSEGCGIPIGDIKDFLDKFLFPHE